MIRQDNVHVRRDDTRENIPLRPAGRRATDGKSSPRRFRASHSEIVGVPDDYDTYSSANPARQKRSTYPSPRFFPQRTEDTPTRRGGQSAFDTMTKTEDTDAPRKLSEGARR